MYRRFLVILMVVVTLFSCKKWKDEQAVTDPRLTRPYCNDPEAVNYNWDFPGKPDNTTCFFPTDIFNGAYTFTDSVYSGDLEYNTSYTFNISLIPQSKSKFLLSGFCNGGTAKNLTLTADRYYKAAVDSLILPDSSFMSGQVGCRPIDTLSGSIIGEANKNKLRISFTVLSDTGTTYHIGTAIKQ